MCIVYIALRQYGTVQLVNVISQKTPIYCMQVRCIFELLRYKLVEFCIVVTYYHYFIFCLIFYVA
jgi:hypothetical protein